MIKSAKAGVTLLELLIVSIIMGTILVPCVGMMSKGFDAEVAIAKDINTKQSKIDINQLILSKTREAAAYYYIYTPLSININNNITYVWPEFNALAVLVPEFDGNGNVVQPSVNVTTFHAYAFSILPKESNIYELWESETEFDLAVSPSDSLKIVQSLPTGWYDAKSYLVSDKLKPAFMDNLGDLAFDIEGDMVTFAFVPIDGYIYFPSYSYSKSVDDSRYITSCEFRNYRIR